ncbi:MAG: MerR family transcriptional regulator [Candidatus Omnitrophica bacterium]|nr:MerR family transcriptional regulator [Candidatus Omnitrophota bacterium]
MMVTEDKYASMGKKRYNIQEIADLLGVYKGTIKNYESKGIFPKARRNPINHYREYAEEDLDILRRILLKGK